VARPIKVLCASEDVKTELRRRANGRSNEHRKRFRAEIILLRLQGVKIEDVATRLNTSVAAGIADARGNHAFVSAYQILHAPEAPTGQNGMFFAHWISSTCLR
jgi:hypothetical protein